jgi:copper homeostasis protein CutC
MNDLKWLNQFPQIDTILTSGGALNAVDGIEQILMMKKIFNGKIMGAGKIIPKQLSSLHEQLGLDWYHGRNIVGEHGS